MNCLFLLSGDRTELGREELVALSESYGWRCRFRHIGRIMLVEGELNCDKLTDRAAYLKWGGIPLKESEDLKGIESYDFSSLRGSSFSVRASSLNGGTMVWAEPKLGKIVKEKSGMRVDLENPDVSLRLFKCSGIYFLTLGKERKRMWVDRRPRSRPFFHPSTLYPKLARALVNLARVKEQDLLLDPFCGAGSIPIEARLMGINSLCIDLDGRMCRGALKNLGDGIVRADALRLPLSRADGVATDLPYGRASSLKGREVGRLAEDFLSELLPLLKEEGYCVLMHPSSVEFDTTGFELRWRHEIYVHNYLTRAISVLKKV